MNKVILSFICCALLSSSVSANELLVISGKNSKNSKKWHDEVYQKSIQTTTGGPILVKLVTVEADNFPKWILQAMNEERMGKILGTPTFIIWDNINKKELGRLEGYTEKRRFFIQLSEAILQVSQGNHPGRREGSGGHKEEGSGGNQRQKEGSEGMSQDIMDHIYKTSEEAKRTSKMLGLGGQIHSHETPQGIIYMPGQTM
jgi:hypothetical protein